MAMAARMPMIATTIISSMRVKPRWLPRHGRRVFQKRSIRSSLDVTKFPSVCCESSALSGATLRVGRERERRGARLRESDDNQGRCERFSESDRGEAEIAGRRRDGLRRIVEEDEPIDDLIASGL